MAQISHPPFHACIHSVVCVAIHVTLSPLCTSTQVLTLHIIYPCVRLSLICQSIHPCPHVSVYLPITYRPPKLSPLITSVSIVSLWWVNNMNQTQPEQQKRTSSPTPSQALVLHILGALYSCSPSQLGKKVLRTPPPYFSNLEEDWIPNLGTEVCCQLLLLATESLLKPEACPHPPLSPSLALTSLHLEVGLASTSGSWPLTFFPSTYFACFPALHYTETGPDL